MIKPISYYDLAKEAKERGDARAFWRAVKQHARVMKKKKAAARTVACENQRLG